MTRPAILFTVLVACGGCATVTFKPGASPEAMAADERACRSANTDEADYVECMKARGAFVASSNVAHERAAEPPKLVATREDVQPALSDVPVMTGDAGPVPTPSADAEPAAPPAAREPPPANALERVEVASWWKLGGTANGLDKAITACVEKLGEAHRPNPTATVVTVGLRECLRTAGWYPLKVEASGVR